MSRPALVNCRSCGATVRPVALPGGDPSCPLCGVPIAAPKPAAPPARRPAAPATDPLEEEDVYSIRDKPPSRPAASSSPPAPSPAKTRTLAAPAASAEDEEERELLLTGTNEDDDRPYTVRGDRRTQPCPACKKKLPLHVILCAHCGFNLKTGEEAVREYQPVEKEWESGWPLRIRFLTLAILQAVNVLMIVVGYLASGSAPTTAVGWFIATAFQVFFVGTYDRVTITRNCMGGVKIIRTWRVCFMLLAPTTIRWRDHEEVTTGLYYEASYLEWAMFIILLPSFLVPAILWWWFVIRPCQYHAALIGRHGFRETILYRGINEAQAEDIAQTVHELTGLPYMK